METSETVICLGCGQAMAPRAGLMICSTRCYQREFRARRRRERRLFCARKAIDLAARLIG
jgi:hypothetical protein